MATSTRTFASSSGLSRGRQLEAAVDSLSSWYFEYDEPKSGWHNERIHPLPEESSASEPQDDVVDPINTITTHTSAKSSVAATRTGHHQRYSRYNGAHGSSSNNNQEENEAKPPAVSTAKSDQMEPPRSSIRDTDRRSSGSTRGTTVASTGSSAGNDLVVSGYTIRGSEKRVMYHIDVRGYESQLQTYTIRRSYTDFKHLHQSLTEILEARREHYHRTKAAVAAAFARHSMPDREKSSRDTRTSLDGSSYTTTTHTLRYSNSTRSNQDTDASAAASVPTTSDDANEAWFMSFTLPPLPNAGFLSFWRRHDRTHVENRCEMFQEILRVASMHRDLRESYAMQSFLSIAPCAIRERGSSYVSLCEYSVPRLDLEEETRERKKLARERRRNSSAHPTTASEQ